MMMTGCKTASANTRGDKMESISLTPGRRTMKQCIVGAIGLAVLLGSSAGALAKDNFDTGQTYCICNCAGGGGVGRLVWKKVGACHLANGKRCTSSGRQGALNSCDSCKATSPTICDYTAALSHKPGGGVIKPPAERGDPAPSIDPFSKSGMNAPIMRRGVGSETSAPSSAESDNTGK